jgi:hypothetical protein
MSRRIRVLVDVPEPRPVKGRLAVGADGSTWDYRPGTTASNVWIDPCTSTVMLAPLPVTGAWATTFSGNYARYAYADFTGTDIGKWSGFHVSKSTSDTAIRNDQVTSAAIELTTSLSRNTPMWFRFHRNAPQDSSDAILLSARYNYGAAGSAPDNFSIEVKFRANGSISVFKNGNLEATYDRSGSNFSSARAYTSTYNPTKRWVNVMIIPFRTRELLVWTDNGTCFSHTFEGLEYPNDPAANPITPAGTFSFVVPTEKIGLQVARIYFETSGYIMGALKSLRYAPSSGEWGTPTYQTYSDNFGAGATMPTITTSVVDGASPFSAFSANGSKTDVRIKVAWSGSTAGCNAGVYCADAWSDPTPTTTYDGTIDITDAITSLSMETGEDGRTTLSMSARIKRLIDKSVPNLSQTGDRPIAVQISSPKTGASWVDLFRGTLSPPEIVYETGADPYTYGTMEFRGVDRYGDLDVTMFPESVPNDNNTIAQFLDRVLPVAGYDRATYVDENYTTGFTLPFSADMSRGNYSMVPKRADYVGGYINQYRDEYLATWYLGWRPTSATSPTGGYKFQISDPDDVGNDAPITLYQSYADAQLWGGYLGYEATQKTIRSMRRYYESPEANQVTVVGQDPKTNRLLTKTTINLNSQIPGTAPGSRPDNWRGRPIQYILTNENLTTQDAVDSAADLLYKRLGTGRYMIEWESDLLTYFDPAAIKSLMRPTATITVTNGNATISCVNQYADGTRLKLTTTIGNLTAGTEYFVVNRTATGFGLATTSGGSAITPSAGGTSVVSAYWLEASNTLSIGDTVKVERSLGGFAAGTTYYVVAQDVNSYQLSATSGGSPIAPTAYGSVNVFDGDQHTNVVWIGDTVAISLPETTVGVEPDLLGTYQIIAIPQIRLVRESTSDDDLHIRSCVYRGLYKALS